MRLGSLLVESFGIQMGVGRNNAIRRPRDVQ